MRALGFIEAQRSSDTLKHGVRDSGEVALLKARVVVDAYPRE